MSKHISDTHAPMKETASKKATLPGEGVPFERTRRITGYLVGTIDRFNNAKRAEERDRIPHGMGHGEEGEDCSPS